MALRPRQAAFVREYLVDLNATQAAIRAGYSAKTAESQGSRLLRNVKVAKALGEAQQKRTDKLEVKADDVLRELLRIAQTDIGDAFDKEGRMKALHEMPLDIRRAISGVEVDELFAGGGRDRIEIGQTRKLKLWDKVKALELLARHLKLLTDKTELTGENGGPLVVELVSEAD